MKTGWSEIYKITCKILFIIVVVELMIMHLLPLLMDYIPRSYLPWLNAIVLALGVTPFIVSWVIKPYVSKQLEAITQAEFSAYHDPLTKLPNRRLLTEHIDKSLALSSRNKYISALIFLDLDGFKKINDQFGHLVGDGVLVEVANRLSLYIRTEDIVSRHGGDEFVIFLQDVADNKQQARVHIHTFVEKIRQNLATPIRINEQVFQIESSYGVSILAANWVSSAFAIHEADMAMYQAKKLKQNKLVFSEDLFIEWYSYVKTGVAEIDREHQQIDFMVKNFLLNAEDKQKSIKLIAESLKKHFYSEEWISEQKSLQMTAEHIQEHRRLESLLSDLSMSLTEDNFLEAFNLLEQMVKQHVSTYDTELLMVHEVQLGQ